MTRKPWEIVVGRVRVYEANRHIYISVKDDRAREGKRVRRLSHRDRERAASQAQELAELIEDHAHLSWVQDKLPPGYKVVDPTGRDIDLGRILDDFFGPLPDEELLERRSMSQRVSARSRFMAGQIGPGGRVEKGGAEKPGCRGSDGAEPCDLCRSTGDRRETIAELGSSVIRSYENLRTEVERESVYVIQCEETLLCKVGISLNVHRRLGQLRVASSTELRLVARFARGGAILEQRLHEVFADERVRGEWYRPSARLIALVHETQRVYPATAKDCVEILVPEELQT